MATVASLRSSFFANRLRAGLWIAAVVAGTALVVIVVFGLRPHHSHAKTGPSRRAIVAAYIGRVDRIELAMAPQVREVDRQYKLFAKDPRGLAKRVPQYRRAERTLTTLRNRLARVQPPREARRLHALLVELADENRAMAAVVTGLAEYLPRLSATQAPLRGAIKQLRSRVAKARTARVQARAFADYAATTTAIADRVVQLRAPSYFVGARAAEAAQLRRLASLASSIGEELVRKHVKAARKLVAELGSVQAGTSVVRAQHAGALAYNARLQRIRAVAKQIEAERKRLEKHLPA